MGSGLTGTDLESASGNVQRGLFHAAIPTFDTHIHSTARDSANLFHPPRRVPISAIATGILATS